MRRVMPSLIPLAFWALASGPTLAQTEAQTPLQPPFRPAPGSAPSAVSSEDEDDVAKGTRVEGVDVVARRDYAHQVGAVVGDITPEVQLSPADIRTYGVSSLTELLGELAPQLRSERGHGGAPVVLLNGRRISGFAEIQNIPAEAILRVDILPEEVALKYGYAADQRVANIVLRPRFRATSGELVGGGATEGAEAIGQAEANLLRIREKDRLNLDLKYRRTTALGEADRDIVGGVGRDLLPDSQTLSLNAVIAHPLSTAIDGSVNAGLTASRTDRALGAFGGGVTGPRQYADGWTAHLGGTLNMDRRDWRFSLTGVYDHADTQTDTDAFGLRPSGVARSIADAVGAQALANGPLLKVPAGVLSASVKAGDTQSWQSAKSTRSGALQAVSLSRNDANAQLSLDLPLTSRKQQVLGALGDLSINANGAVDQLSDFGTLTSFGYGLNWTPRTGYSLTVSRTDDEAAPTVQQLGGPVIVTPGAQAFDYVTGRTVSLTQIGGANPDLVAEHRRVLKIGVTAKPVASRDLSFTLDYTRTDIDHPILTFPGATAALQGAFPARFVRDDSGQLVLEDIRPVNFASLAHSELRAGLSYSRPIGKQPPRRAFSPGLFSRGPGGPQGSGGFGGGRGGAFGGFPVGGRLQFAAYHTLYLVDRETARPGGPVLDLLGGAPATGSGGQYRNEVELQFGMLLSGIGGRMSVDWRQGTRVTGLAGAATGDLNFSDLTTINFRLFDNFTQQKAVMKRYPWLRGSRLALNVNNLLDQRVRVRDGSGATPLGYQGPYLDPAGRTITLSFRKLFF